MLNHCSNVLLLVLSQREINPSRDLVTKHMGKAEILSAVFTLVFACKIYPQESQAPETSGKVWSKEDLSLLEEDEARVHLSKW